MSKFPYHQITYSATGRCIKFPYGAQISFSIYVVVNKNYFRKTGKLRLSI